MKVLYNRTIETGKQNTPSTLYWGQGGCESLCLLLKCLNIMYINSLGKNVFSEIVNRHLLILETELWAQSVPRVLFGMAPPVCSRCGSRDLAFLSDDMRRIWAAERGLAWNWKDGLGYWRLCQACHRKVRAALHTIFWVSPCMCPGVMMLQ